MVFTSATVTLKGLIAYLQQVHRAKRQVKSTLHRIFFVQCCFVQEVRAIKVALSVTVKFDDSFFGSPEFPG